MPYGTGYTTLSYDIENRLIQATNTNGTETYAYGPDNRRVYQKMASGTELVFFYGVNGDRLRTYQLQWMNGFSVTNTNIYFAGRLISANNGPIRLDRLGSVRNWSRYYPFGEEQGSGYIPEKFATYYRDTSTSLDYAMNRYYGSTMGRFTTPDPYGGSANLENPQSWNRYAYVNNDPVNNNDPTGLFLPGTPFDDSLSYFELWWVYNNPMSRQFAFPGGGSQPPPRLFKDLLVYGAANLIYKKKCGDFLVSVGQKAFLDVVGKSSVNELNSAERTYYDAITTTNLKGRLQGASFYDKHRPEEDQYKNIVRARSDYGIDGTGQSISFFDAFIGQSTTEQSQIVVHESMHLINAVSDSNLARGAGVYKGDKSASEDFQTELKKHCK